jgi:hypothetical protein
VALYVARQDDVARHRGTVVRLHASAFAPPPDAVRDHRLGRLRAAAFRSLYLDHLQALWRQDPEAFLRLIALASGESGAIARTSGKGGLTLVDDWGTRRTPPGISSPPRSSRSLPPGGVGSGVRHSAGRGWSHRLRDGLEAHRRAPDDGAPSRGVLLRW